MVAAVVRSFAAVSCSASTEAYSTSAPMLKTGLRSAGRNWHNAPYAPVSMVTSCTADRAVSIASETRSTLPACRSTRGIGNWTCSAATTGTSVVVLIGLWLAEPRLERVDHRPAGLGVGANRLLHLS